MLSKITEIPSQLRFHLLYMKRFNRGILKEEIRLCYLGLLLAYHWEELSLITKRVLVTGARAPATLELIKNLAKDGCEVYAVDSVPFALGFYTKSVKAYEVVPPAKQETDHFIHKLIEVIQRYQIDLLIPTCEEIFYIAKFKCELEKYTSVFCENIERLTKLHHKYEFIELAKSFGLQVQIGRAHV